MYRTNYQLLFSSYPSTPTLILMWVLRGLHSVDWTRRSSVTADGWWKQSQCPGYKAPVPISADQSVPGPCRDHTAMHTPATWYTVGHVTQLIHVTQWLHVTTRDRVTPVTPCTPPSSASCWWPPPPPPRTQRILWRSSSGMISRSNLDISYNI